MNNEQYIRMLAEQAAFHPAQNRDYAPNAVQLEFIRLAAAKYRHIGFGDTHHGRPELAAFAVNRETLNALAAAGKKNFFLEYGLKAQSWLDALHDGRDAGSHPDKKLTRSSWLQNDAQERLHDVFARAAHGRNDIRFVSADTRATPLGKFLLMRRVKLNMLGYNLAKMASVMTFLVMAPFSGKRALNASMGLLRAAAPDGPEALCIKPMSNDRRTAAYMRTFNRPAAILYGSAHWTGMFDSDDKPRSLRRLLGAQGPDALCVLNVYPDAQTQTETQAGESRNRRLLPPDASLHVYAGADEQYGIRIHNEKLRPLFEQAVSNAAHLVTPAQQRTRPVSAVTVTRKVSYFG